MNPCVSCIEIKRDPPCWVETPNRICCDCSCKTPEERERLVSDLCRRLALAGRELRDRLAEAALIAIGAAQAGDSNDFSNYPTMAAEKAYRLADAMLEARAPKDESTE